MPIGLRRLSVPAALWTPAELRDLARLAGDQSDASIAELLAQATAFVEKRTSRALLVQRWRQTLDGFPLGSGGAATVTQLHLGHDHYAFGDPALRLFRAPVYWPDSDSDEEDPFRPEVYYADPTTGVATFLDSEVWTADTNGEPARLSPAIGQAWPAVAVLPGAVRVDFWAGYGSTTASVPADLRRAVLTLASHWYEHPEAVVTGTISSEVQQGLQDILDSYWYCGEAA